MNPVIISGATLYHGDCLEILPTLGKVDAVITDPPYGQNYHHSGGGRAVSNNPTSNAFSRHTEKVAGDDVEFDPSPWLAAAPIVLLWGAHQFAHTLPRGTWLVWDKVPTGKIRTFGDGEAAWLNDSPPRALRMFRHLWDGVCVSDRADLVDGRVHPMQKPVALMRWCIEQCGNPVAVLDGYMGSGTTGVACASLGRKFIGIEIDKKHFDTACERIENAYRQARLFA